MYEILLITLIESVPNTAWYQESQWWAILVALSLGVLSLFQENIKRIIWKPKLDFDLKLTPPDSHKTSFSSTEGKICDTYYLRFRIKNIGNFQMENVEVMVNELFVKQQNGKLMKVDNFSPLNLLWSHSREITKEKIQPKLSKLCDFGHILRYEDYKIVHGFTPHKRFDYFKQRILLLVLDTEVSPNTGSNIIEPGEYEIAILVAANNLNTHPIKLRFTINDRWSDDEGEMLNKIITFEKI